MEGKLSGELKEKIPVCVFGDSIAFGAFDTEKGGWVDRLKSFFLKERIYFYNCGVSGDNTESLLKRFEAELTSRKPEVVVFAIGINDSYYIGSEENPKVDIVKFKENLKSLINKSKESSRKIVFIGLTKVDESKTMPWHAEKFYSNERISKYNDEVKNSCEENGLTFIDIFDLLQKEDLFDGLHPNKIGHEKIFQLFKNKLNLIIERQNF